MPSARPTKRAIPNHRRKPRVSSRRRDVLEQMKEQHSALLSAQAELEASRARYAEMYDSAPVGYVTLDHLGIIREVNLTAAGLLGFSRRQLVRQPLLMFLAREDRRKFLNFLSRVRRLAGRHSLEVKLAYQPSVLPFYVEILAISSAGQADRQVHFHTALIDITARREAEEALRDSEERFRTLASHAPVGIFLSDTSGGYSYVNETWCRMTGFSPVEAEGCRWLNAVHPEDRKRIEEGWKEAVRNGGWSAVEFRFLRSNGIVVWVQAQAIRLKNDAGKCIGCLGTVADITERKRMEAEAEQTRTELLAASRAKDDFLAMLSHELRTPLNPVLLLAGDGAADRDLPPGVRTDFDAIRKNVETQARLIDDLLDITRITHGKLAIEKQQLEIHDVLRKAIAMVQNEMEQKGIALKLAFNAAQHTVVGDTVRLQQVFWNILKNAIKFTSENGNIFVETSTEGVTVNVKITDTGSGISAGDLGTIFGAFSQGVQPGRTGLGLGLAISKKLVELHAGSIRASSPGKNCGATFSISLPLALEAKTSVRTGPRPAPVPLARQQKPARRSRILLVEDHEPTRAALTRLLLRRQFEVTGAGSVAEARSAVHEGHGFDLLISDIGLPDGNGYDLMNELHVTQQLEGIALTGYGMEEDVQRSHEAGFATHLTKPVKIESLDHALAVVLSQTASAQNPKSESTTKVG